MNFEDVIYSLTKLLQSNDFLLEINQNNVAEYILKNTKIRIAYSPYERSFTVWVGQAGGELIELLPKTIKEFFNDNTFNFQTTITVDNLICFLKGAGKDLLSGDEKIIKELYQYSCQENKKYNNQMTIDQADRAWVQKDYGNFIKYIDQADKDLLQPSYLKKYKIAMTKISE